VSGSSALQWLVVAGVVAGSIVYAAWTLMPAALRRAVAGAALKLPLPTPLARRLRVHATATSSCACSGCDRNPLPRSGPAPVTARPITLHRRLPR